MEYTAYFRSHPLRLPLHWLNIIKPGSIVSGTARPGFISCIDWQLAGNQLPPALSVLLYSGPSIFTRGFLFTHQSKKGESLEDFLYSALQPN